jgi:hypothetical protein
MAVSYASPQSGDPVACVASVSNGARLNRGSFPTEARTWRMPNVFPHRTLAQVRIAHAQGRQNPAVVFRRPPSGIRNRLRIVAVPKRKLPHRDELPVNAPLVADEYMERPVESGVPAGDVLQALRRDRFLGSPDDCIELSKLPLGEPAADDAKGIPLQYRSEIDEFVGIGL